MPWPLSEVQANLIATRQIAREVIADRRDPDRAAAEVERIVWGRYPTTPELQELLALSDELDWDPEYQRYIPTVLSQRLEAFARLACLTDEQIGHKSASADGVGK